MNTLKQAKENREELCFANTRTEEEPVCAILTHTFCSECPFKKPKSEYCDAKVDLEVKAYSKLYAALMEIRKIPGYDKAKLKLINN